MLARVRIVWVAIRDSLWFLPAILTLLTSILAIGLVQAEYLGLWTIEEHGHWLLWGGAEGAREVLSTIAGSLITVTGVVFSVTIVALQLASSQYTPRILRNFTADRSNQWVLGVFISTFTYTLLVLRVVHSSLSSEAEPFVPRVAVAVAIIFLLISVGFLIYFIHHASRSIQIAVILDRATQISLHQVEKLFPEQIGIADTEPPELLELPEGAGEPISAQTSGYLKAVDGTSLFALGERENVVIRMEQPVGAFLLQGEPLATVWPQRPLGNETKEQIHNAFVLGEERTPEQDVQFGIIEISDIAVKALSPGINDPTTAYRCIDRLNQILLALGTRRPPPPFRTASGNIHFIAADMPFDEAVQLAFRPIYHFGKDNPAVIEKLLDSINRLVTLMPLSRRPPLIRLAEKIKKPAEPMND